MRFPLLCTLAFFCTGISAAQQLCDEAFFPSQYRTNDRWAMLAHQGKDGWLFGEMDWQVPQRNLDSREHLQQLVQAFKKQGTQVVMVDVPPRLPVHQNKLDPSRRPRPFSAQEYRNNYAALHRELQKLGIIAPNLLEDALKYKAGPYFQKTDHHWTTEAAKHVAGLIAKEILKLPAAKKIPGVPSTLKITRRPNNGSYARMANTICNSGYKDEVINSYEAVEKQQGSLLGEVSPDVVVVGTSFSERHEYTTDNSFPETLKHALQKDVLNAAVEGGGSFAALEAYLMSETYQKHRPRVLVWENTFYNGEINNSWALWRLIPLVRGGCSSTVAWKGTGNLSRRLTIDLPRSLKLGKDYALKLQFSDTRLLKFQTTLDYAVGSVGLQTERSWRIPNNGEYYTLLVRPDPMERITVHFEGSQPSGTYSAVLCKLK
ncbi:alginate O-acetyltransferase AlgX-related protein [Deinococcus cellulosilyticus]|uniref:Alginate biosynthesis protein AlgX n=1 Tax=Deinococcus cellulosilyticus (strain DSM 18568 / NBRC 106333 / KACC 11606 / 5516J-15) TaxID=1223518 RepID=A0A511N0L0_DEIC1|nr:hypothetical protein [Deinococcus cellulosilyticus]GEM46384.1 alginate biosynthesis protein AlgX [Deinococcus cellulosilyticus NBRC 106333 = KACC 11606]